jgi:hypothetical protein
MDYQPFFPVTASLTWVLVVFGTCLLVFHVAFVWLWRLGRTGWRVVDYVWLTIAVLGLLAGVAEVRRMFAVAQIEGQRSLMLSRYGDLRREVRFLSGDVVCRRFVRSEYSPPTFDADQQEYNAVCDFARQLYARMTAEPPENLESLGLTNRPRVTQRSLTDMLKGLDDYAAWFVKAQNAYSQTVMAAERSDLEKTLTAMSPLFLAVALALRITKVTGEFKLGA